MSTKLLDYIAQRDYLIYLSEKLETRRDLIHDLGLEPPEDLSLHCESCEHALDSIKARKAPVPSELFDVFSLWEARYFPKSGMDIAQANETRSLYKQGNSIEYLADLYDLPIEYIVEYIHTTPKETGTEQEVKDWLDENGNES